MIVNEVSISNFNANPSSYLYKDVNGAWNYDVLFFGTWDSNNGRDLNYTSSNLVKSFILDGYGCIFGHDTIQWNNGYNPASPYFGSLAPYVGLTSNSNWALGLSNASSTIQIVKKGLMTSYPWDIGDIGTELNIPVTHCVGQTPSGKVWMEFTNQTAIPLGDPANFYITTYNNCAMVQTGHSSGQATDDEQKVLANLIFYCYQVTTKLQANNTMATDETAPSSPTVTLDAYKVHLSAIDYGTNYYHKVQMYSKDNFSTPVATTNITYNEVKTGVKGYRYIIDDSPDTVVTHYNSSSTTDSYISFTEDSFGKYIHVASYDGSSNLSNTTHKQLTFYKVTYDANGGTNAPDVQIKVPNLNLTLSSTQPIRTGYTFKGWSTSSSGTTVEYNSGSNYTTNANLKLYAVWKANEYNLEIDPNGSMAKVGTKTSLYSPSEDTGTPLIFDTSNWSQIDVATRTGYDLKGYYDSDTGGVEVYNKDGNCVTSTYWNSNSKYKNPNNLRVYAQWIARQDIHYEVNHYLMDVNGSTYTFKENVVYNNGTSDAEVTIANYKKVYDGFTYDGGYGDKVANASKPSTYSTTTTILQDGKRVINLYYTRNRYTLTVNPSWGVYEGSNIPKTYTMYYEETKEIKDPTKENAKFIGWNVNGNASTCTSNGKAELGGGTSTFKMGLANTTLTAYWSELPVFSSTALQGVFYEGQDVTVAMLKQLVTVSDVDKTPTKYDASDINIESVIYKEGSTRVDTSFDNEYNLDTSSERIGQIVVKYSVKDVIPNMGNITDKKYDIVTVYFDRVIELAYNDLPSIEIEPYMYVYNGDKSLDKDTIGVVVKDYVTVKDIQDDVTTDWWNNEFTKSKLRKSIEIVGLSDIEVSSAYLKDNPDFVNVIKDINTLEGIYSLLETAPDGFKAITSYRVTVDVKDQWGKYASGKLSEYALDKGVKHNGLRDKIQSDTDRTILVICTDDASYNNAYNGLRYVSTNYLGTLNANSYWGDVGYGNKELQAILKRGDQVHADNEIIPTNQSIGTYTKEDGSVVKLIINDYVLE